MMTGFFVLKTVWQTFDHLPTELGEFRTAVIDSRHVHCAQNPVGHGRRAGDLKEVPSGMKRHG